MSFPLQAHRDAAARASHGEGSPQIVISVHWPGLDGNKSLTWVRNFDGSPEVFAHALRIAEQQIRELASVPMRQCGYPGPWHEP